MSATSDKLYGRQGGRWAPDTTATDRAYEEWRAAEAARVAAAEVERARPVQLDLFEGPEPA